MPTVIVDELSKSAFLLWASNWGYPWRFWIRWLWAVHPALKSHSALKKRNDLQKFSSKRTPCMRCINLFSLPIWVILRFPDANIEGDPVHEKALECAYLSKNEISAIFSKHIYKVGKWFQSESKRRQNLGAPLNFGCCSDFWNYNFCHS